MVHNLTRLTCSLLLLASVLLVPGPLLGHDPGAELAKCKAITDGKQRLACFDRLAADSSPPASESAKKAAPSLEDVMKGWGLTPTADDPDVYVGEAIGGFFPFVPQEGEGPGCCYQLSEEGLKFLRSLASIDSGPKISVILEWDWIVTVYSQGTSYVGALVDGQTDSFTHGRVPRE